MKQALLIFALLSTTVVFATANAAEPYKTFADFKVLYSAFNSSFISPDVAATYSIIRGKDKGLVNIAVIPEGASASSGGKSALVTGHVANIFAQQQKLDFFEVNEGGAIYYLALFRFDNEDPLTFKITVQPDPDKPAERISFQRTFYHDK